MQCLNRFIEKLIASTGRNFKAAQQRDLFLKNSYTAEFYLVWAHLLNRSMKFTAMTEYQILIILDQQQFVVL